MIAKPLLQTAENIANNVDASGYAISERMRVQIRGLDQDRANTQDRKSVV